MGIPMGKKEYDFMKEEEEYEYRKAQEEGEYEAMMREEINEDKETTEE